MRQYKYFFTRHGALKFMATLENRGVKYINLYKRRRLLWALRNSEVSWIENPEH